MEDLLKLVSKGDERAFRALYEKTYKMVFAYIYRLCRNHKLAEDIMCKTYVEVWKSASKFKGESKVETWILGIARNITFREFKIKSMLEKTEFELNENLPSHKDPFSQYAETELIFLLKEAINKLPVKYREVLDLVFFHNLKYEEISKILKIPINTVKTRVFLAKKKLKEILNKMGVKKEDVFGG